MRIVIRADAAIEIGSGHIMRCLTLADRLRCLGGEVSFVCRDLPGNLAHLVEEKGYRVARLAQPEGVLARRPDDVVHAHFLAVPWENDAAETAAALGADRADWLIVDHYGVDQRWEERLRPQARRIMVIDDLADRRHDCDLLLDQNLYDDQERRYDGLVPPRCRKLLGPSFALLRHEFLAARAELRERDGVVRRLLIFFGGSDPSHETAKALLALRELGRDDLFVDVVAGAANPHLESLRELCAYGGKLRLHVQTPAMARLMLDADLALGAGGSTTWERCWLGLPAIVFVVADNQLETTLALARRGIVRYLGRSGEVTVAQIAAALRAALLDPTALREMGEKGMQLMEQGPDWVRRELVEVNHAGA